MGLSLLLFVVFAACVAMLWTEGFWGNALTLINVTLAGLIATAFFEPVANALDGAMPSYTYLWDFIALWMLFAIVFSVFRLATDILSKAKVRFAPAVEITGKILVAIAVGNTMASFVSMSVQTAPLTPTAFGGVTLSEVSAATRPGVMWLQSVTFYSRGSLSSGRPFDGQQFFNNYGRRRTQFEQIEGMRV